MRRKLCVLDLDGTALKNDLTISKNTVSGLNQLREIGYMITIATGRLSSMTIDYQETLDIDLPIVSCNGAILCDQEGLLLHEHVIARDALQMIIDECKRRSYPVHLYSSSLVYSEAVNGRIVDINGFNEKLEEDRKIGVEIVDDLLGLLASETTFPKLLIPLEKIDESDQMLCYLKSIDGIEMYRSGACIEVVPENCSKGNGLKCLCQYLDINLQDVVVFGDSENDESMFEIAGKAIAMANGSPQLKAKAHHITKSNNEDGIAHAINTWLI